MVGAGRRLATDDAVIKASAGPATSDAATPGARAVLVDSPPPSACGGDLRRDTSPVVIAHLVVQADGDAVR